MAFGERKNKVDKRTWINIGLLAFIFLLSAFLYYSGEETKPELPHLSSIDPKSITQIEIIRKDKDNFSFTKKGDAWYMSSPIQVKANIARINAMLHLLNVESHGTLNPAKVKLARFELADPKVILKLNDHVFQFGNTDAIDQRRYVLFENKIQMINDSLYPQLMIKAPFFADTKLLPDDFEITAIKFPENSLEKIDGKWKLQQLMDIKPNQLNSIASSWKNASAISVSKYKAPESESLITISAANNETIHFVIVATEPHLILGRKDLGIEYHLGSDDAERMLLHENKDDATTNETTSPG